MERHGVKGEDILALSSSWMGKTPELITYFVNPPTSKVIYDQKPKIIQSVIVLNFTCGGGRKKGDRNVYRCPEGLPEVSQKVHIEFLKVREEKPNYNHNRNLSIIIKGIVGLLIVKF